MAKGEARLARARDSMQPTKRTSRVGFFGVGFAAAALLAIGWVWIGGNSQPDPDTAGLVETVGARLLTPGAERPVAPQFQFQTVDWVGGELFDLEAARGEVVVLLFMAAWCLTCEPEARALARIHNKYSGQGVTVLIVDIDLTESEIELQAFSDRIGPNGNLWALAADSNIVRKYGVKGLDGTIMIDREGRIAYVDLYPTPYEVLDSVIEALL